MYCWKPAQCSLCFYLLIERLAYMLDLVWHGGQVLRGSLPSSELLLCLELAILTIPLFNLLLKIRFLCVQHPPIVLPNVSVVDKACNGHYSLVSVVSPSAAEGVHTLGRLKPSLPQIIMIPFEWRWGGIIILFVQVSQGHENSRKSNFCLKKCINPLHVMSLVWNEPWLI